MKKLATFFAAMVWLAGIVQAQTMLTGTVKGDDGDFLAGATVLIKETNYGTATDLDGIFSISIHEGGKTLVISYVGYETVEVAIEGRSHIDAVIPRALESLKEVVITGYTEIETKKLISSISSVDKENIGNRPMTDVNQLLQGQVPGLFTTASSGQPGAAQIVRIRGTGSLHAGANPLYVVDGIIVQNGDLSVIGEDYREPDACCISEPDIMAQINPNDIENVTVLKDASATALYGSRGSNGVIVITTKRGKPGKSKVSLNAYTGVTMPNFGNFEIMNAEEQWHYERKVYELSGYTPEQIDELRPASMLNNTTDWLHEAFVDGQTHNLDLQVRGGNEKTRFFASGGYFFKDGTMFGTDFERYSLRTNVDHAISDRVDIGLNLNGSYTHRNNAYTGNHWESPMLQVYFNTPMQGKINPATGELYTGLEEDWIATSKDNFLYSTPKNDFEYNQFRLLSKLSISFKILDNLVFTQNGHIDFISGDERKYYARSTFIGSFSDGLLTNDFNQNIGLTNQSKLKYFTNFGPDHSFDILGVFEYQRVHWKGFGGDGWGFLSDNAQTFSAAGDSRVYRGHETDYAFLSYLGLANYSFKEKYMFMASLRRDGSSRFGANNRWANFWSLGASWRISEEPFLRKANWLNELRLRTSYGTAGNAAIGNFNGRSSYLLIDNIYQGEQGSGLQYLGNDDLTWEVSKSVNVGIDFSVLENRLGGTVEYYSRRSENVFLESPVSSAGAGWFFTVRQNPAKINNSGWELTLNTTPFMAQKPGSFNWDLSFNISFNDDVIKEMPNHRVDEFNLGIYKEGYPVRTFPLMANYIGINPENGERQYLQQDGSIVNDITEADRYIVRSPHPEYIAGLNSTVSFKGFTLSALFYTAQGQYNDAGVFRYMDSHGGNLGWVHLKDAADFWEKPGDQATRPKPQAGGIPGWNSPLASTEYLFDGSFIRLRNIDLGYALPEGLISKAGLQSMVVSVRGQNLITITDYPGMDPEGVEWGRDNWRYPVGKSVTFGVDVTF